MKVLLKLFLEETLQIWTLDPERVYVLGSSQSCDIPINLPGIAERHLEFGFNPFSNSWFIRNLSGLSTTYINDQQILEYSIEQETKIRFSENYVLVAKAEENFDSQVQENPSLTQKQFQISSKVISQPSVPISQNIRSNVSKKFWLVASSVALFIFFGGIVILSLIESKKLNLAQNKDSEQVINLYPIWEEGKHGRYGFINKFGEIVVPPQFSIASNQIIGVFDPYLYEHTGMRKFREEALAVAVGDSQSGWLWGFIDKTGKFIAQPQYREARDFNEGMAAVLDPNSRLWGFIDKSGKLVINYRFTEVKDFSEGLAAFHDGSKKWGFIDRSGNIVIRPQFSNQRNFSIVDKSYFDPTIVTPWGFFREGLAAMTIDNPTDRWGSLTSKWGFIDRSGRWIIEPAFRYASSFTNGIARVENNSYWVLIDKSGKEITQTQFWSISTPSDGLVAVSNVNSQLWGFVDEKGKIVIDYKFHNVSGFKDGLALAQDSNSQWGIIDRTGNWVVKPQFASIRLPNEGMAAVQDSNSQWGFIDKRGNWLIQPQYAWVDDFNEGLAGVQDNSGLWGFVDKSGRLVIQNQFMSCGFNSKTTFFANFRSGLAQFCYRDYYGNSLYLYINRFGKVIWPTPENN